MASTKSIKKLVAYWMQLGQPIINTNTLEEFIIYPIYNLYTEHYSKEFNLFWDSIKEANLFFLKGFSTSIKDLSGNKWYIAECATCSMPCPKLERGINMADCICEDIYLHPNNELPQPKAGVNTKDLLNNIITRIN
jgi:hypothetical protein